MGWGNHGETWERPMIHNQEPYHSSHAKVEVGEGEIEVGVLYTDAAFWLWEKNTTQILLGTAHRTLSNSIFRNYAEIERIF